MKSDPSKLVTQQFTRRSRFNFYLPGDKKSTRKLRHRGKTRKRAGVMKLVVRFQFLIRFMNILLRQLTEKS